MGKSYVCQIEVRGYELDSFGHVNHATYIQYLEHARWKMLEEEQITLKKFIDWKRWPVIASVEVHYLKPTYMGDRLEIHTQMRDYGKARLSFSQKAVRAGVEVLKATIHSVTVNERGRPDLMPEEVQEFCRRSMGEPHAAW